MNSSMGETYQDRVRYYRRKSEQERTARSRKRYEQVAEKQYGTDFDFDEALYNFKNKTQFEKMYSNAKQNAHKHAKDHLAFYRDDEKGYIGGVCAGIAGKMKWDVKVVRIVTFLSGLILTLPTLLAYIAATVFLRKKHLAFYGRNERNFWKSAAKENSAESYPNDYASDMSESFSELSSAKTEKENK